ncbi:MAG: hypothetical protein HW380_266 [Magnetococcales bacterium]|nr:hypothetical protein [Magnetococcales bacterium]
MRIPDPGSAPPPLMGGGKIKIKVKIKFGAYYLQVRHCWCWIMGYGA